MKIFEKYRFTQQVRSQVRRHGFWAMRNRSRDWPVILETFAEQGVLVAGDLPEIYTDEPAADSWGRNREGYGFLLANEEVGWVVGCLPVGETWFCRDWRGSFSLLEAAFDPARSFAAEWDIKIAGIYHTELEWREVAIPDLVPSRFKDLGLFLYLRSIAEDWPVWSDYVVAPSEKGDFKPLEIRRDVALNLRRRWNQRRILKGWRERWGQSEYLGGRTPATIEERAVALAEALEAERKREAERTKAMRDMPPRILTKPPIPATRLGTWKHSPREQIDDSADPLERFLLDAVREERTVEFTFIGVEETTHRKVRPIRLFRVADFDRTYLEAFCETRQALRTFSLHRIATGSIPGFQPDPPKTV